MKRAKMGLLLIMAAVLAVLFSCRNDLLLTPVVPKVEGRSGAPTAPDGLSATQGAYRNITLSWNPKTDAALYYVYRANSPLDIFERCGETTTNQFKMSDTSGKTMTGKTLYYKVSYVAYDGTESPQSIFVRGTSLAQPFITDITDITDSSVTVTWYMDNAKEDTYKDNLLYTVYCFDGTTEVAQKPLDGATLVENKATFDSLKPNATYKYQVEAYLRSDQNYSEKSDRVDANTARKMRPAAPVNLRASRGTATDKIEVSFELPDMVDVALGDGLYEPKPVYFVIYKRQYSVSGTNVYHLASSYFGSMTPPVGSTKGEVFGDYIPDATVTWTDTAVTRGVEYQYQVQSYVDGVQKVISSDSSLASATGWALSVGSLSFGSVKYEFDPDSDFGTAYYASAELPLNFIFDPKDIEYDYTLVEKIKPIEDTYEYNPDGLIEREVDTFSYIGIKAYKARMNLTQKTTEGAPGRGIYSYAVEIKPKGKSEIIDTVATFGEREVSEDTDPIIVDGFDVQDGYKDKFVLKWNYRGNRKYILYMSSDNRITWEPIHTENPNPDDESTFEDDNHSYTYTDDIEPGITRDFAIRPYRKVGATEKAGQMEYATAASMTLGVPELSLAAGASYSIITAVWSEAQKADAYRIKYWYVDEGKASAKSTAIINKGDLSKDASEKFNYTFTPFENNAVDVAKAGLEIQVEVEALNKDLQEALNSGEEIATTSQETVTMRLVGPALLNPQASRAASTTEIEVSWDRVSGASGYYVFRWQFNMNNSAEEGTEAIVYYVPYVALDTSNIGGITGKNMKINSSNERIDTNTVKARARFSGSRYTFTDTYMNDGEYDDSYKDHIDAYKNQQNDMAQGYSYHYYIVPVVNRGGDPEPLTSIDFAYAKDGSNKNTGINYYTIRENSKDIRYSSASTLEKEGFIIGFGQNVTATKGTYASSGNVNDKIQISWTLPAKLVGVDGFSPRYTVYRKPSGSATWDTLTSNITNATQYIDDAQPVPGIAYEYVVGIANGSAAGSDPRYSRRFIEKCGTLRDEKARPHYLGFMLDMVKLNSISREPRPNNAEEVKWYSAGIKKSSNEIYNADYNWGIEGYTVFVMNRNIDAGWHEIADVSSNLPNEINQSILVTNASGLLKVMRDYRHYFKVRSYVLNNEGAKVYCPDPPYTYSNGTTSSLAGAFYETDYVKWGARQVTLDEFAKICTIYISRGFQIATGTSWTSTWAVVVETWRRGDASSNYGGGGYTRCATNAGVTNWKWEFRNFKTDMRTKAANTSTGEDWVTFISINGDLWIGTDSGGFNWPKTYGRATTGYNSNYLSITGPGDVNGMYSGTVWFGGNGTTDVTWNDANGKMHIIYPSSGNPNQQTIMLRGQDTALPFQSYGREYRHEQDAWK